MQWQTSSRNRALCFNVDLFLLACELQRLHITIRKALSDDACLALGKVKIGEGAPPPPGRADVADTVIHVVAVLDLVNLNHSVPFFDGDREPVSCKLFHDASCRFRSLKRHAAVMQPLFLRAFPSYETRLPHPPLGRFLAFARNDDTRKSAGSDFQLLRKTRENLAAGLRHYDHVFVPDAAEPGIIKSRLDRQHLSIFQGHLLQPRIFMDLQADPMAGAVEKSNVFPFSYFGGIAALLEKLLDRLVNFHSVHPGFDFSERELLPCLHCLPELAVRVTSASAHDGARQIAPVTGLRVARENIEDDQRIRVERTEPALVRIASLIAAGHDCFPRLSAATYHSAINS